MIRRKARTSYSLERWDCFAYLTMLLVVFKLFLTCPSLWFLCSTEVQEQDPTFLPSFLSGLHHLLPALSLWHPGTFQEQNMQIPVTTASKKKWPCAHLTVRPLTLSVQSGWHVGLRHICSWSTWCLEAGGPPWEANAGRRWEWWRSQWTSCQRAALHFATLRCPRHPSTLLKGQGQGSLVWEPFRG